MKKVQPLRTFEHIKLLADSRRMKIMQLLMDSPATLTQLANTLGQSPAWVRHHIQKLEDETERILVQSKKLIGEELGQLFRSKEVLSSYGQTGERPGARFINKLG